MDYLRLQRILFMVAIVVLAFAQADLRSQIKVLEARPNPEQEIKDLTAKLERAQSDVANAQKTADFAVKQAFEAKEWINEDLYRKNEELKKQVYPNGTTYKSFMGGK